MNYLIRTVIGLTTCLFFLFSTVASLDAWARQTNIDGRPGQIDVPVAGHLEYLRYPSKGRFLVLWMASERGLSQAERETAAQLARRGVEVWVVDFSANYFLDVGRKAFDKVPAADMQSLISVARASGKDVKVFAIGRAAVPMLLAYGSWPPQKRRPPHLDFVLMHPNLYEEASALEEPEYIRFGNLSGAHLLILQPSQSAGVLWLDRESRALEAQGAEVRDMVMKNVREGFWQRQDATANERAVTRGLADRLLKIVTRKR